MLKSTNELKARTTKNNQAQLLNSADKRMLLKNLLKLLENTTTVNHTIVKIWIKAYRF
ncbi:MAG: hypothetical protein LBI63_02305 [Candidatus Ancillula sp.]|jgi:hypothetical protein|nr:hypothetical protein [Candidatus Ancillula sp.]